MPAQQRRDGFDAVNAAAQAVAGVQTPAKPQAVPTPEREKSAPKEEDEKPPSTSEESAPDKPAPTPTAASPRPSRSAPEAEKAATDLGPGKSLRTTGSKVVALTFDDGPDPVQTPRILELLDKYQVKATFCLVGTQVKRHPEIVRDIVAAGHTLCNHTWDHSLKIGKDQPAKIQADLLSTNAAIQAAAPDAKVPFFRAPGGNFTERLVGVAGNLGMTSLYWEVDPRDWDHPEKETAEQHIARVVNDIRGQVKPGAIVLSHDFNQPDTIAAYEKLLPYLAENFTLGIPAPSPEPSSSVPADS
ncbi:polysaccharide deacetylase family protein [Actinoplanes bogorensis]|uniref:Polysaccharide deacetylase family protein n=2 Tax=Paractinoplanes bogorensis TaxID=1610840 RepID=A0ABS5YEP5_9ACTN|nr:polysaccharide deacetylase family protein [Actinoplanes bogorensis]